MFFGICHPQWAYDWVYHTHWRHHLGPAEEQRKKEGRPTKADPRRVKWVGNVWGYFFWGLSGNSWWVFLDFYWYGGILVDFDAMEFPVILWCFCRWFIVIDQQKQWNWLEMHSGNYTVGYGIDGRFSIAMLRYKRVDVDIWIQSVFSHLCFGLGPSRNLCRISRLQVG